MHNRIFPYGRVFISLDPAHSVAPHSAAPLTPAPDPGQDPVLTLILPVDPAHAPMAGRIPAPLTQDAMAAATDDRAPAPVPGLTGIVALVHHGPLPPTDQGPGRDRKGRGHTGRGLARLAPVASGPAAPVDESRLLESSHRMS